MNAPLAPRARTVDIEDVARFDALVARGAVSMHGWHFQAVDLRGRSDDLARLHAGAPCSWAARSRTASRTCCGRAGR